MVINNVEGQFVCCLLRDFPNNFQLSHFCKCLEVSNSNPTPKTQVHGVQQTD